MTQNLNLHIKLNKLFLKLKPIEDIIEFIYKNLYKLIDEIPFVTDELGANLKVNYRNYY